MAIAGTLETAYTGNPNLRVFDITALDADTGPTNIAHGMLGITASSVVFLVPTVSVANWPGWAVTLTSTNIVLSKQNAAGSGGAVPGTTVVLRVVVWTPHSSIQ